MNKILAGFLFLIMGLIGSGKVFSQTIPFGFFRIKPDRLVFTTSAQSIYAGNCSGITTVQNQTGGGVAKNVPSNLTVNLTAVAGITYYSDANCTTAVTSVIIASGTSSSSFYYISDTTGTKSLGATTGSGLLASQNQTISINPFVWTGGGGNVNWNTGANWSGGAAPSTASHVALFDSTCAANCSPTVNTSISIGGIRMSTGYAGTITQGAANTITLGGNGWSQLAGTFTGGSSAITLNGPLALVGGTFTSPSNTITANSIWTVGGTGVFNKSTGTVYFVTGTYKSMVLGTSHYNNVKFGACGGSYNLNGGTVSIDGTLTFEGGCGGAVSVDSGSIMAYGNVTHTFSGGGGNVTVTIAGNVGGQTITGISASASFPSLVINAGANAVTFSGAMIINGDYTVTSAGSLTTTGSTLIFNTGTARSVTPGTFHYNNVTFGSCGGSFTLNGGTMSVDGTLTFEGGCGYVTVSSGSIMAYGNVTHTYSGGTGNVIVTIAGNAAGQTITGISATTPFPKLVIDAGANPVTLSGTVDALNGFTVTSAGSLTTTGSTLILDGWSAFTITPGTFHYNNVTFTGCGASFNLNGGTMSVDGTLSFGTGCVAVPVSNGILEAYGNVVAFNNGAAVGGTVQLKFVGSTNQTVTVGGSAYMPGGNVTVATTAGAVVNLASAVSWNAAGQTTTVTSGAINMAGYALTVKALSLSGTTVTKNAGTLTVNGSVAGTGSLYGGTVAP